MKWLTSILLVAVVSVTGAEREDPSAKEVEFDIETASKTPNAEVFRKAFYEVVTFAGRNYSRRQAGIRLFCLLRKTIVAACDPKFNIEKVPAMNLIPSDSQYESGVSPSDVKDPLVRADYERAIAKNSVYAAYFSREVQLRQQLKLIDSFVATYCQTAYGSSGVEQKAMEEDLQEFKYSQQVQSSNMKPLAAPIHENR